MAIRQKPVSGTPSLDVKIVAAFLVLAAVINLALVGTVLAGIIPRLGVALRPPLSNIGRYGFYAVMIIFQLLQLWIGIGIWRLRKTAALAGAVLAAVSIPFFYFTSLRGNMPINALLAAYFLYLYSRRSEFAQ